MPSTILITGCSSGFGRASALYFLDLGWNVIATMRTPKVGLSEDSDRLLLLPLDVTEPVTISSAIEKGIAHFGRIDVFVNNAGIGYLGAHEAVSDEAIRQLFETNTFGVMAANRAIIPYMREQGSGTIINVTSSVGIAPMPLVAVYTASKYAIEGFSESLAYELGMLGIRVKIVQPGLAPSTHFAANSGALGDHPIPSAYAAHAGSYFQSMQNYPTGYTTEADVARAVHTAATDGESRLRYPAGADSEMLANLRKSLPEGEFIQRIRTMTGSEPSGRSDPERSARDSQKQ